MSLIIHSKSLKRPLDLINMMLFELFSVISWNIASFTLFFPDFSNWSILSNRAIESARMVYVDWYLVSMNSFAGIILCIHCLMLPLSLELWCRWEIHFCKYSILIFLVEIIQSHLLVDFVSFLMLYVFIEYSW